MGCPGKHKMSKSVEHLHTQCRDAWCALLYFTFHCSNDLSIRMPPIGALSETHLIFVITKEHISQKPAQTTGPGSTCRKKCGQFHNFGPPKIFWTLSCFPRTGKLEVPECWNVQETFLKTLKWPGQKVILSLGIYLNVQFIHFNKSHEVW